ncbi:hypothetical protein PCANC_27472 [Puccinia coronata f. sp. avenae]|uniref:Myb/SANT-like domain-containing protein n=1 Tax=Puccinia coronata f. sp. avenae TaxID=200324 RepID=A0A2N5TVZ7_9BASI|nr:hypothetical protein PCANC_27472 [Puccinia coronata f. sp. avenae]
MQDSNQQTPSPRFPLARAILPRGSRSRGRPRGQRGGIAQQRSTPTQQRGGLAQRRARLVQPRGRIVQHSGNRAATMRLLAQLASSLEETQAETGGEIPEDGGEAPEAGDEIPEDGGVAPDNEGKDPSEDEDPEVHPDNETFAQPKKKQKRDSKSSTHQFVAQELRKAFPDVDQLLTHVKVKSKLSQSAKRDYNAFVACKAASGFGWDELTCEVTASNDVWEKYLGSHPNAKKFQGVPFPEFWKLEIIFGLLAATGKASRSVSQLGLVLPDDIDTSMEGEGNPVPLPTQPSPNPTPSPTNYLSRSHTKKDNATFALEGLTGYLMQQQDCADERARQRNTAFAAFHAASQASSQSVNS